MIRPPQKSTLFPHPPLSRFLKNFPSNPRPPLSPPCATAVSASANSIAVGKRSSGLADSERASAFSRLGGRSGQPREGDRKSTRLNSSHGYISYAVFCLKKKK